MDFWWHLLAAAIVGGIIGGGTDYIAIWLLFRPLEPKFVFGKQLPLTPGVIPKQKERIARSVAKTITSHLFTGEDIRELAKRLVTAENIDTAVDHAVDAILKEFQDTANLHRLAAELGVLSDLLWRRSINAAVDYISWEQGATARLVDQVFDYLLAESSLTLEQSNRIADWVMRIVLTPDRLRLAVINVLTPANIANIDTALRAQVKGRVKLFGYLLNFKTLLTNLRDLYEKEPEEANRGIELLLEASHVRLTISTYLAEFNPRQIPWQSVEQMRAFIKQFFYTWVVRSGERLALKVDVGGITSRTLVRLDPASIPPEWLANLKLQVGSFVRRYLERDLERLVQAAIPRLDIAGTITSHVLRLDPLRIERLIYDIAERELNAIIKFGTGLGAVMGICDFLVRHYWGLR